MDIKLSPHGVCLGVDVGSVRVGVAKCDPSGILATPVETVPRDQSGPADLARIAVLAAESAATAVYLGLPRRMDGTEGPAAGLARDYSLQLARAVAPLPVRLVDERLSTVSASRGLRSSGVNERKGRKVIDQAAAVVLLQAALDFEKQTGRPAGELVSPFPEGATST